MVWIESPFFPLKDIHPDSSSKRGGLLQLESGERSFVRGEGDLRVGCIDKIPVLKAATSWLVFRKENGESETQSTSFNYSI